MTTIRARSTNQRLCHAFAWFFVMLCVLILHWPLAGAMARVKRIEERRPTDPALDMPAVPVELEVAAPPIGGTTGGKDRIWLDPASSEFGGPLPDTLFSHQVPADYAGAHPPGTRISVYPAGDPGAVVIVDLYERELRPAEGLVRMNVVLLLFTAAMAFVAFRLGDRPLKEAGA